MVNNVQRKPVFNATAQAADKLEEVDNVIQFFQAALTRAKELQFTAAEKDGLFTVFEWQRGHLKEIQGLVHGAPVSEKQGG